MIALQFQGVYRSIWIFCFKLLLYNFHNKAQRDHKVPSKSTLKINTTKQDTQYNIVHSLSTKTVISGIG